MTTENDKGWLEIDLAKAPEPAVEAVVESEAPAAEEPPAQVEATPEPGEALKDQPSKGIDRRIKKALEAKAAADRRAAELEAANAELQRRLEETAQATTRREDAAVSTFRQGVQAKLESAKKAFVDAYNAGDSEKLLTAQEDINRAQMDLRDLDLWEKQAKAAPAPQAQPQKQERQVEAPAPEAIPAAAQAFVRENPWFGVGQGKDELATRMAAAISDQLVRESYDPEEPEFYAEVKRRLVEELPRAARLIGGQETRRPDSQVSQPRSPVAAPSRRGAAQNKVRIDENQAAMASRLGIPLEEYAYQQHRVDVVKDNAGYTPISIKPRT